MDPEDLLFGLIYQHVKGGAMTEGVEIEWKGPFISIPESGPARMTLFERAEGDSVWEMTTSDVDRALALVLSDILYLLLEESDE